MCEIFPRGTGKTSGAHQDQSLLEMRDYKKRHRKKSDVIYAVIDLNITVINMITTARSQI